MIKIGSCLEKKKPAREKCFILLLEHREQRNSVLYTNCLRKSNIDSENLQRNHKITDNKKTSAELPINIMETVLVPIFFQKELLSLKKPDNHIASLI